MTSIQADTTDTVHRCRYHIREKFFAITVNFKIKDEFGRHKYTVKSNKSSFGRKLLLQDINGQ